jgi:hypothetical protein
MADKKPFSSIIDAMLADREPEWKDLGLADAHKSGEEVLERTHDFVDKDFIDEISEGVSHHTAIPPSKTSTLQNRIYEKEKAAPQVASVQEDWRKNAVRSEDYKSKDGDNESLMAELTMTLESAASGSNLGENSADKKEVSNGAIQRYIRNLLNMGTSPAKVAAQIEKLAEIELFNKGMATDYLQRNAGMIGMAYLEPNTFMDKENPNYKHTAAGRGAWRDTPGYLQEGKADNYPAPADMTPDEMRFQRTQQEPDWRETPEYLMSQEEQHEMAMSGSKLGAVNDPKDFENLKKLDRGAQLPPSGSLADMAPDADTVGEAFSNLPPAEGNPPDPAAGGRPSFRPKSSSGSNECVRQHNAFKQAGIAPRAKSVKQISACEDCSFFKKDASGKSCNLYHLPVVANAEELSQIVNNLTPGVPLKNKRAALVRIANREDEHAQMFDAGKTAQSSLAKVPDTHDAKQAQRRTASAHVFTSAHLAKLHEKGVSLFAAYKWADRKFGSVETSVAFRGFVQTLQKNAQGRIVLAKQDLQLLNHIGIRSEKFEAGAKCASCPKHFGREARQAENERGAIRVGGAFSERVASSVHTANIEKGNPVVITAGKVRALHQKGHSLEKIYRSAAQKVGSLEAKKAVAGYVAGLRKQPGRVAVNASDRSFLVGKLSFRPESLGTLAAVRRPTDQVVSTSGDSPVLSYPGKRGSDSTTADGHAILGEYDLSQAAAQQDIDVDGPDRLEVESRASFRLDE